jgi:hypothetical protein
MLASFLGASLARGLGLPDVLTSGARLGGRWFGTLRHIAAIFRLENIALCVGWSRTQFFQLFSAYK